MISTSKPRTRAPDRRTLKTILLISGTALLGTTVGVLALPDQQSARAAEPATPKVAGPAGDLSSLAPDLAPVWIGLTILCIAAGAVVMITRRTRALRSGNGSIHVVDTQLLGGRRMIHLVRVDGRKYLIGNSERGVHFLASIPQNELEEEVDELTESELQPDGETPFSSYLALSSRGGR